ncbi:MAG: hypothetical protein RL385_3212 [Pseudomonadota bacterium]|jgi:hypothetical protein
MRVDVGTWKHLGLFALLGASLLACAEAADEGDPGVDPLSTAGQSATASPSQNATATADAATAAPEDDATLAERKGDGSVRRNANARDAGAGDASVGDAGVNDAGLKDAGVTDASVRDAGARDAGVRDAGTRDAGPKDAATTTPPPAPLPPAPTSSSNLTLPPVNATFDSQLGGDYPPPAGVSIVSRDRLGSAAPGLYNICYVNAYQTQGADRSFWLNQHAALVLRDSGGDPVIDVNWPDEMMLDTSSAEKRAGLAAVMQTWMADCAARGFKAIEIDNLDSYTRSGGRLSEDHAVAYMGLLSQAAHALGLAIAQKNGAELTGRKAELGTDFVIAESCSVYNECAAYTRAYGDHVLFIEYDSASFQKGCTSYPQVSIVLRDQLLSPSGTRGYVFQGC